jgi:hypothetical protein
MEQFEACLEDLHRWLSNPGSIPIWLGKYRGHEFRLLYNSKRRLSWHLEHNEAWAPMNSKVVEEYENWLDTNRRICTTRAPSFIENPKGEALGPRGMVQLPTRKLSPKLTASV